MPPPAPHVYLTAFIADGAVPHQVGNIASCAPPIASLILALRQIRAFTADPSYANEMLGPLVSKLDPADKELQMLLSKFGWCSGRGFAQAVDMRGLQAALQKFQFIKLAPIGNGAYGSVHKVMNRETRELLAIKQVPMAAQGLCDATLREISALQELDHPNIIKLRDVIANTPSKYCYLVLELLDTDLNSFMRGRPALKLRTIKSIMFQVLSGLRHAHCHSIMHRDLKPQNILLRPRQREDPPHQRSPEAEDGPPAGAGGAAAASCTCGLGSSGWDRVVAKIADFGLARGYLPCDGLDGGPYTDWVVTLFYRAPELLLGLRQYGPGVDVWSAGCVMAEMLTGAPLFSSSCEIGLLFDMFRKLGTPTSEHWGDLAGAANFSHQFPQWAPMQMQELVPQLAQDPGGLELLSGMLCYDPRRRITASQALHHHWFDDVRREELAG
ncbi:hypothetical protein Vafri_17934 [Volvox africanus]|uniref:cyclin-dependent kinase n=1 Tax=Volvox africanus TaxID=51714 RepID=A0A8J4BRC6_9CHLO|nr:hypothetical protein Vafri_17934 [Volvox africanus]